MNLRKTVADYERWLGRQLPLIRADLGLKHRRMREGALPFLRATYFRWAQLWPDLCPELKDAPAVLAVGDLHVENFGTWRDAEGRLAWGINDFDEAWRLPYANDLVRLATSVMLAGDASALRLDPGAAASAIITGYRESLVAGGRPLVLAEHHPALRRMAIHRLRDPEAFWHQLDTSAPVRSRLPPSATSALSKLWPARELPWRIVHRVAGLGSLGRQRFVALAEWNGGRIAREAKGLTVSAGEWAAGRRERDTPLYREILAGAVRCADPFVAVRKRWLVRRLAPDCSRIELASLPRGRDERRLLHAMGWETANVHLGSIRAHRILSDLDRRPHDWLVRAADTMSAAVKKDFSTWRRETAAGF
ncbi:MAG: DUF2252 family protein [Gemmatimonadaceae bacterium]|nr:DUF2252 family protein [Gemmatimonadaceae bacterium]